MFERFSSAAIRVMMLARLGAGRLRSDAIDTPHLLLAFIDDDQGTGALEEPNVFVPSDETVEDRVLLKRHGDVANPFLEREVAASLRPLLLTVGPRDEPQPNHVDMPLSDRAERALSKAIEFAGNRTVMPLHIFWAMLGEEQGDIADLLSKHGFNRELIEKEIRTRESIA